LSLAALVPALCLGYEFAFSYDDWFSRTGGSGLGFSLHNADLTQLFVTLIFLPFELATATPALILSLIGTVKALRNGVPHPILAVAGVLFALASLTLSALLVATAWSA